LDSPAKIGQFAASDATTKRERKLEYFRNYYKQHREEIRHQQRQGYEQEYQFASDDLLRHLREHQSHALDKFREDEVCAECQRMGLRPAVCLECGRIGLDTLDLHLRLVHKVRATDYREKWGYNLGTSLTSLAFRDKRSDLSNTPQSKARMKKIRITPETTGRRHKLRPEAIEARISRRGGEAVTPTKLTRRLKPVNMPKWAIVSRRLEGKENEQIASELGISETLVNKVCRVRGLPVGRPARYWRGEAMSDHHLVDVMRDHNIGSSDLAERTGLPAHRIQRALRRKGRSLQLDVADRVLQFRRNLLDERTGARPLGGRHGQLLPSEEEEFRWKYGVVLKEIRTLCDALADQKRLITPENIGELLCALAQRGQVRTLLLWASEFLEWLGKDAYNDMIAKRLSPPYEATREFLADQFAIEQTRLRELLAKKKSPTQTLSGRCLLLDLRIIVGARRSIPTRELLTDLPRLRDRWRQLSEHSLANLLRPLGIEPVNVRVGKHVLKSYRRSDICFYTTQETAVRLGVALVTLKNWISDGKIPAPPIIRRVGIRGSGNVRLWVEADIQTAKSTLRAVAPGKIDTQRSATR
jgi:hypothetical protein